MKSLSEGKKVVVSIANPSTMRRTNEIVHFEIPNDVEIQVEDFYSPDVAVKGESYSIKNSDLDTDLRTYWTLLVDEVDSLATRSYVLSPTPKSPSSGVDNGLKTDSDVKFDFEITDDSIVSIHYTKCSQECQSLDFEFEYRYYTSYEGKGQKSGLYIFRDEGAGQTSQSYNTIVDFHIQKGDIASVMHLRGDKVDSRVVINNYADVPFATVTSDVHGIEGEHGVEVTVNFRTEKVTSDRFYTDSNGMIMEERIINQRKHYDLTDLQGFEVVSNFYPVNSAITLRDDTNQFTILNDRAQSGTSLRSGEIEILIHRRTTFDDDRGVEEPLDERNSDNSTISVQIQHQVIGATIESLHKENYNEVKRLQRAINEEPLQVFYSKVPESAPQERSSLKCPSLPNNIKLVLKVLDSQRVMARIYNMNEHFDNLTEPTSFDLSTLVNLVANLRQEGEGFSVTEWNLSLNKQVTSSSKINWSITDGKATFEGEKFETGVGNYFDLGSQEMRSFIFNFGETSPNQVVE
mmetsp:Transcript_3883/g.3636  ORF Transcript_3883/g.3636 Transcript_3883/m.3636 type:complete len:519 (+) Transcript_3883:1483-3039(+)